MSKFSMTYFLSDDVFTSDNSTPDIILHSIYRLDGFKPISINKEKTIN